MRIGRGKYGVGDVSTVGKGEGDSTQGFTRLDEEWGGGVGRPERLAVPREGVVRTEVGRGECFDFFIELCADSVFTRCCGFVYSIGMLGVWYRGNANGVYILGNIDDRAAMPGSPKAIKMDQTVEQTTDLR